MKIKWFAHASFLIEGDGLRIITDPYTPDEMGFPPITEPADIVIRSSSDDGGHCFAEMIPGEPEVVTATDIIDSGITIRGLKITAIPVRESLIYKDSPLDNGMYRFTLEGLRLAHMGDVGNPLTDEQLDALANVDVLFVLAGGPPTIDLDDLREAIDIIQPRVIIPMHYHLPGTKVKMLPITELAGRFSTDEVVWLDSSEFDLSRDTIPLARRMFVLRSSLVE
ncbi:MAG: MBL fold metallo-hydrolase [Anaerolineae bacterium]|nr:MBL fold metallo-hydrolase [Anaerolineae bacterium]